MIPSGSSKFNPHEISNKKKNSEDEETPILNRTEKENEF
jgi:hypothetical protein